MANQKMCVECGEHPAIGLPRSQGRMHDTCFECMVKLRDSGVDVLQPKPKEKKVGKRAEKAADRERRFALIEERAAARRAEDEAAGRTPVFDR